MCCLTLRHVTSRAFDQPEICMTTHLDDLFDEIDLEQAIDAGHVREQVHPTLPFSIYNYTDRCTWEQVWTPVTLQCRGLIVHRLTREVLARPYPKFFNSTEPDAPKFGLDDHVTVTDKMDGSLGILYPTGDGGYAIATRGSFASDQAQHATVLWQDRYADRFRPDQCMTMLFEIVYRTNRIVVDYGDLDDLVLLGSVEIATGCSFDPGDIEAHGNWPGPKTKTFYYSTFREALEAEPRSGQEGLVVRRAFSEDRVKLKQDEYVALHRILTGVTARHLWEFLAVNACWDSARPRPEKTREGFLEAQLHLSARRITEIRAVGCDWKQSYLEDVPEEFYDWVTDRVASLEKAASDARKQLMSEFSRTVAQLTDAGLDHAMRENRHEFVKAARATSENWLLLMRVLDGQEADTWCWLQCYPDAERPFRTEDAA